MAGGANTVGIAVVDREESVIAGGQGCRDPCGRGVACSAGSRPARRDVIWACGAGKVLRMAGIAICRRTRKHVVNVAKIAGHGDVRTCQRERRVVVIEGCACPIRRGVARVAGCGEARRGMGRVRGSIPVRQVAPVAERGQRPVISAGAGVALHACHRQMEARERERRRRVIESRRCPVGRRVAYRTVSGEAGCNVVGVCCSSVIRLVAGVAGGRC